MRNHLKHMKKLSLEFILSTELGLIILSAIQVSGNLSQRIHHPGTKQKK
jgi:hypothetical protein